MRIIAALLLAIGLQGTRPTELAELRGRASTIAEQADAHEITNEQARRQVQLLVTDFEAWAETHDMKLELRTRTVAGSAEQVDEPLSVDRCMLFFEERAVGTKPDPETELCLIDLKHSEIWGTSVLFCRYLCE